MVARAHEKIIDICRQRLAAAPAGRAFAPLADALREAGRYEEALPLLEEGLIRHPRFIGALVVLGHTLLDAGRVAHARKVLDTVLERDAENLVALRLLAENACSRQDWPSSVRFLERLVVSDPDDERWPAALAGVRTSLSSTDRVAVPEASLATLTLVDIYLAQGYRGKAMKALRRMQLREPERADILEKIEEIDALVKTRAPGAAPGDDGVGASAYGKRRELMAAKRAEERKSFEEWVTRVRDSEGAAP